MNDHLLNAALVVLLAVGLVALPAAAATDATISSNPPQPSVNATHSATAVAELPETGSWTGFRVDYGDSGASTAGASADDIVKIGIDRGGDNPGTEIDEDVSDDVTGVTAQRNGRALMVFLEGDYQLAASDEVVVVYDGVENPPRTGDYPVNLTVNPQNGGSTTSAHLAITGESSTHTVSPAPTPTPTAGGGGDGTRTTTGTATTSTPNETTQSPTPTATTTSTGTAPTENATQQTDTATDGGNGRSTLSPTGSRGTGPAPGFVATLVAAVAGVALALRRR